MTNTTIPHRYEPEDWLETRTGEALERDTVLKQMLREEKQWDNSRIDSNYKSLFNHVAAGLFECTAGSAGPNLNADYLSHAMDICIWVKALGHSEEEQMPHTTKSKWTPREVEQRPWSIKYGVYFHNRAFLDGEGAHVTRPDGTVLKNVYRLKDSAKQADNTESQELLQTRAELEEVKRENAELRAALSLIQADVAAARSLSDQVKGLSEDQDLFLQRIEAQLAARRNDGAQA